MMWMWMLMMGKHSVTVWKGGLLMDEHGYAGRSILRGPLGVCMPCSTWALQWLPGCVHSWISAWTRKHGGYRWADRQQLREVGREGQSGNAY